MIRSQRTIYLTLGLLIISASFLLFAAGARSAIAVADQDLSRYWRTTYDILVRPAGARTAVEAEYNLVEANHLSGLNGGITLAQYDLIKGIPGVETAAPIAMLGYVTEYINTRDLGKLDQPGAYKLEAMLSIDNGVRCFDFPSRKFYYTGSDVSPDAERPPRIRVNPDPKYPLVGDFFIPFLVAAIDPSQEATLAGLDQAIVRGAYLRSDDPIDSEPTVDWNGNPLVVLTIPALVNAKPYIQLDFRADLKRLSLPPEASTLAGILEQGGIAYLESLPEEKIMASDEVDSESAYQRLVEGLLIPTHYPFPVSSPLDFVESSTLHTFAYSIPSPIQYQKLDPPFSYQGIVLEIILPPTDTKVSEPSYRVAPMLFSAAEELEFSAYFNVDAKGVFDIENLPRAADVNKVPLETYFPPLAILRYDEKGQPVEPRTLSPTLNPASYIQSPPLLLTTLEAARRIVGEDCISAIRVRVGGVEQLDRPAQQKIEAVASEIHRLTGLDVDIVVGSSPKRILVHVPEIGYVEEQWIQKNINTLIGQSIGRTNWFLLWLFSGVSVLFVLNTVLVSALQRQRAIGLLKALGWRSSTVFGTMLREILLAGGVGWLAGAILALGLAWLLRLQLLWEQVALSLPFALALCVMGGSLPIWVGIRRAPVTALQMGQVNVNRRLRIRGGYGFQSLLRRPARSLIVLLGQAAGSGLVVLIFLALYESQGYLMGTLTLLGEYIQQRIEGYHYLIAALCLGLSAMALSDQMILAVREQAAEVGLLIAVGWRRRQVFQMFISQGLALGMAGGIMGAVSAVVLFWVLSGSLPLNALWIGPLGAGVCVAVSGLAAWFPARQAAGLNPVEAIRSGE